MSVLLSLLSPTEREAFDAVRTYCGDRYRPLDRAPISKTKARALAKLGVLEMRRGMVDDALLVRVLPALMNGDGQ